MDTTANGTSAPAKYLPPCESYTTFQVSASQKQDDANDRIRPAPSGTLIEILPTHRVVPTFWGINQQIGKATTWRSDTLFNWSDKGNGLEA